MNDSSDEIRLLPERIQKQMTKEEAGVFAAALMKIEAEIRDRPLTHRNPYDDMLDVVVRFRMAVETGNEKQAYIERALRLFAIGLRWSKTGLPAVDRARIEGVADLLSEVTKQNPRVLAGSGPAERADSFRRAAGHVEAIWQDAVFLFGRKSCGRARFLAITCLEEASKLVPGRMVLKAESIYGVLSEPKAQTTKGKNPLFDHAKKWSLAAAGGVLMNARLLKRLGIERFEQVLSILESGEVKVLREDALYSVITGEILKLPEDLVTGESAAEWIVIAGEVMAEICGFPKSERARLLAHVEGFESRLRLANGGPGEATERLF